MWYTKALRSPLTSLTPKLFKLKMFILPASHMRHQVKYTACTHDDIFRNCCIVSHHTAVPSPWKPRISKAHQIFLALTLFVKHLCSSTVTKVHLL